MKNCAKKSLAGIFVLFIAFFAVLHISLLWEVCKQIDGTKSLSALTEELHNKLLKKVEYKLEFLDLNGLFARLLHKKEHNEIIRAKGNMLLWKIYPTVVAEKGEIAQCYKTLKAQGIDYFYMLAPCKNEIATQLNEPGCPPRDYSEKNAFLKRLQENDVPFVYFEEPLISSPEKIYANYYLTDHHWNMNGAFLAFQYVAEELKKRFPPQDLAVYEQCVSRDSWKERRYRDQWLGTMGIRVGRLYTGCGMEDFAFLEPTFTTNISRTEHTWTYEKGAFFDSCIDTRYLTREIYNSWAFATYLSGDCGLVKLRNPNAPIHAKLFIIKDSFGLPVISHLTTVVDSIDIIDPRRKHHVPVAEYIRNERPDMVMHLMSTVTYNDAAFFKVVDFNSISWKANRTLFWSKEKIELEAAPVANTHKVIEGFENGATYEFKASQITVNAGTPKGVAIGLFNREKNEYNYFQTFDLDYYNKHGNFTFTFKVPQEGSWGLVIFSGPLWKTENIGITVHQPTIHRLDFTE